MFRSELRSIFGRISSSLWLRAISFAGAYFVCAEVGRYISPPGDTSVRFWLPAGLYVAVLMMQERRTWWGLMLGAAAANCAFDLLHGTDWRLIGFFCAANAVQAGLGAWLVQTFVTKRPTFATISEFFGVIGLAGLVATLPGALLGAGALQVADPGVNFLQSCKTWWGGCAMAVLLFTPLVLTWWQHQPATETASRHPVGRARLWEAILLYGGLIASTWGIFVMGDGVTTPYKFRTLPFLLWAGLRFGRHGSAAASFIYGILVAYSTSHSLGSPATQQPIDHDVVFTVQTFLFIAALVGMIPAIALAERDRTSARLHESETHYRNLTEAAFEGVCISEEGRLLDVSDQLLAMIGYERHEVLGRQIPEFIVPENQAMVTEAIRTEKEAPYLVGLRHKDGHILNCEVRAKQVQSGGRTLRMTALRDITERLKAEEALRASEARLRAVSDNLPNGIVYQVVREPDGAMRFLHVSAGVERIHGVSAEAVLRDPQLLYRQISPEDRDRLIAAEEKSFRSMGVFDEIMRVRRPDGELRWVRLCSAPRHKPDGRVIWDGIEIDITESKRAEEALRQSEEKFAKAFISSPSSILITRVSDGRIMEANETFSRHFELLPEQTRGKTVFELGVWQEGAERDALMQRLHAEGSLRNIEKVTILPSGRRSISLLSLERIKLQGEDCLLTVTHDITDLKEAERALLESEIKFRTLFNSASDAIFLMQGLKILDCNRMTEVLFGCDRGQIIGRTPIDFSPETQPDGERSAHKGEKKISAVLAGQPQFFEWTHVRTDGGKFEAEVSLNRVELDGALFVQAIVRDVTNRKQTEVKLKLLSERLRIATAAAAIAVWEWNLLTNEILVDERLYEIYGYPSLPNGRFTYEQWRQRVHPEDWAAQEAQLQRTIAAKSQGVREFRAYRLDGALRHIQAAEIVISNEQGRPSRVIGVNIDITERKCAEEALRENQRMLATLMANLPGMVYRCQNDAAWTMLFVSEGCHALTGYRPADFLDNRTLSFASIIHAADQNRIQQVVQTALNRGGVFELNYRIHTAQGEEKWVWERGQGVYTEDRKLIALEGFITDITAQRKAEAEREAAQKREQETRAEFTRQLIASQEAERTRIAREIHDHLGQLLTALKLDLRSMERRASVLSDTELQGALLGKLKSAKELADETITSVQKIASELRPGILDRLGLAAAIEAEAQTFASRTGVDCRCAVPDTTPPIPQDRAIAAFRIFQEIMTNVARHAHATEVEVRLQLDATLLTLAVADNGVGIPEAQFTNPKSFGLLGMMERAEILGGQIRFTHRPTGSGTVVTVKLPLSAGNLSES